MAWVDKVRFSISDIVHYAQIDRDVAIIVGVIQLCCRQCKSEAGAKATNGDHGLPSTARNNTAQQSDPEGEPAAKAEALAKRQGLRPEGTSVGGTQWAYPCGGNLGGEAGVAPNRRQLVRCRWAACKEKQKKIRFIAYRRLRSV